MDLREESILGNAASSHWYYISKGAALLQFIQNIGVTDVLDVGAGSGFFAKLLLCNTGASDVVCCDSGYTMDWNQHYGDKIIHYRRSIENSEADLALFLDVLEHVEDDVLFIRDYAKKLKRGTHVVVTVPAFQFLFSEHDFFLRHYRRYTIQSLEKCLVTAGMSVVRSNYYFLFLLPAISAVRLLAKVRTALFGGAQPKSNLRPHSSAVNSALILLNKAELALFQFNRLAGMTVFCHAVVK